MTSGTQVRGQPLVALLAILAGWIGGRAAIWEPPVLIRGAAASEQPQVQALAKEHDGFVFDAVAGPQSLPGSGAVGGRAENGARNSAKPVAAGVAGYAAAHTETGFAMPQATARFSLWNPTGYVWGASARDLAPPSAYVHGTFTLSGSRGTRDFPESLRLPLLSALVAQPAPPTAVGPGVGQSRIAANEFKASRRWSGDGWVLMRRGGDATVSGALPATYGASQAGAVLRYSIATDSRFRPTAYLRTTSTLGQLQETSAALGLSARPWPLLPVVAALEARMTEQAGRRRFQPVAMAVTELAPFEMPFEMRGEAYAQAGYVGGKFATPFADGQLRLDRALFRAGPIDARLGAGVWGGMQKGARRLDFGPSAAISMPLGRRIYGRVALDWRFRVLGNAQPRSGPAVTLSAGF